MAFIQTILIIETKQLRRDTSLSRERYNHGVLKRKVLGPFLHPGIEKWHKVTSFRIEGSHVWPLQPIAAKASESKVVCFGDAAMLVGNDMIRFVAMQCNDLG